MNKINLLILTLCCIFCVAGNTDEPSPHQIMSSAKIEATLTQTTILLRTNIILS